jgi:hypothetical protein
MKPLSLLPILFAFHNAVDATPTSITKRSTLSGTLPSILTPDFVEVMQQIVDVNGIPGLTLAVVYQNGSSELGAWGIKSENGTNMTTDVRRVFGGSIDTHRTTICPM